MRSRVNKREYYLDIADSVAERSTCLNKNYGAVIVNDDEIKATGYNGSPRDCVNCCDVGECFREMYDVERGKRYELCTAVHAEQNALLSASRKEIIGGDMYISGVYYGSNNYVEDIEPCCICKRLILNSGIEYVYVRDEETNYKCLSVRIWKGNRDELLGLESYGVK